MEILYCKYCGKECKNKNSLAQHELRCSYNPNRLKYSTWNKGKTKEVDARLVRKVADGFSKVG